VLTSTSGLENYFLSVQTDASTRLRSVFSKIQIQLPGMQQHCTGCHLLLWV